MLPLHTQIANEHRRQMALEILEIAESIGDQDACDAASRVIKNIEANRRPAIADMRVVREVFQAIRH